MYRIKGDEFSIPNLLNVGADSDKASQFKDSSLAIFRLAPADYHRFHSPIDGEIEEVVDVPGNYYTGKADQLPLRGFPPIVNIYPWTVNPQAVNEVDFDVFTKNTRSILYMKHKRTGLPVAFVAIGALLVGSIHWTNGANKGSSIKRGEELG